MKEKFYFKVYDTNGHQHVEVVSAYSDDEAWEHIRMMYPDAEFIDTY